MDDSGSILEVVALCREFLGAPGEAAYCVALFALMSAGLLAYAQVFVATSETYPRMRRFFFTT